jgi:DNA-binding GntR family transcriptional regulator
MSVLWVGEGCGGGTVAGPAATGISENDIASRLGVSRTPVRQAFVQLEAEELLELYPKRGALVVPISASEADDVLEARLLIEQHAVRRVDPHATLLVELRAAIAEQEATIDDDAKGFGFADRRFHQAIVEAAGNAILTRQYEQLRDRHQRIAATAVASDPARWGRFIAEHREILAALERGDSAAAAELMGAHLQGAHELARRR